MSLSRRSPRPFSLALDAVRGDWEPETLLAEVQRVWGTAVGVVIAAQAVPVRERGGVLTVACVASVWAQELELMGPQIVAGVNAHLGSPRLTRLRCVAASPTR